MHTYLARRDRDWGALPTEEIEKIVGLLDENLQEEPNNDKNLRLWVQAVRRSSHPPSVEAVIEKVAYWKANAGTLDAAYYLYVFHSLLALQGSALHRDEAERIMEECRSMARFRRNRTREFEWIGPGMGVNSLVHRSELGEWLDETDFFARSDRLVRVPGRIVRIDAPQSGHIEVEGGLKAFFVPAKGGFSRDRSENQRVIFYLGFAYDGPQALDVRPASAG